MCYGSSYIISKIWVIGAKRQPLKQNNNNKKQKNRKSKTDYQMKLKKPEEKPLEKSWLQEKTKQIKT